MELRNKAVNRTLQIAIPDLKVDVDDKEADYDYYL